MTRRFLLAASLAAAACASRPPLVLPAVGPLPQTAAAPEASSATGTLVVYSEMRPVAKHRSPPAYPHTGYVIRRASGELVAQVDNRLVDAEAKPDEVPLPPGLYQVQARCARVGTVLVPVVVAPGRRTELFLDAAGMPAAQAQRLTDPIALSDGRVVGARAAAAPPQP